MGSLLILSTNRAPFNPPVHRACSLARRYVLRHAPGIFLHRRRRQYACRPTGRCGTGPCSCPYRLLEVDKRLMLCRLANQTLWVSPAALIPSMAQISSSSAVPPLTPTAPIISFPSMTNTPPATGTTLPPDMSDRDPKKAGRSFKRSPNCRLDSPIPTAPQALPMAMFGRKMLAPSSRFSAFTCPPSSNTATHMGLNLASRALARALSTINDALSSVSFILFSSVFLLVALYRVETLNLEL